MITDIKTKVYIDDRIRRIVADSINPIALELKEFGKELNTANVSLARIEEVGKSTYRQAKKTNGRVDRLNEEAEKAQDERNALKIAMEVAKEQHKLMRITTMFVIFVAMIQALSIFFGVPTDQLIDLLTSII